MDPSPAVCPDCGGPVSSYRHHTNRLSPNGEPETVEEVFFCLDLNRCGWTEVTVIEKFI